MDNAKNIKIEIDKHLAVENMALRLSLEQIGNRINNLASTLLETPPNRLKNELETIAEKIQISLQN